MVDDNLHALVISGNPTEQQLNGAWNAIRQDYAEKMGDHEFKLYTHLFKEINDIDTKILWVHELVKVLRLNYVQRFADRLNSLLCTNYILDITDIKEYDRILNICINRTGGWKIRLEMLLINFKEIQKKNEGNNVPPTREYFLSLLVTLSDHAQFMVPDTITVFEFCERIVRAQKKSDSMKKAIYGRR